MFLKCTRRNKDGKIHRYWSVVENRRLSSGRMAQRQVLYLGEINDSQKAAWRKSIDVFDGGRLRQVALFPEALSPPDDATAVGIRLNELQLKRPRQWGACWLADVLWRQLGLDAFWEARLPPSRKGTPWASVLQTLVTYRLIDPGSEWRLHRQWFVQSAGLSARCRFCAGREGYALSLPGQDPGPQGRPHKLPACAVGRALWRHLRCVALRSNEHVLRVGHGPRGRGPSPIWLLARQAWRLPAGGDRVDRDPRWLPVELRGARGQHRGFRDPRGSLDAHRDALWKGQSDLVHG